jgi:hypothetical protein
MDFCSVSKGTEFREFKQKRQFSGEDLEDAIEGLSKEVYLMESGEIELEYIFQRFKVKKKEQSEYNRLFKKYTVEDGDFFGDFSFLLSMKKVPFKGKFLTDSTFWAIRGSIADKVLELLHDKHHNKLNSFLDKDEKLHKLRIEKKIQMQKNMVYLNFQKYPEKFPKNFKIFQMYYFVQSGELTLTMTSGQRFVLKKNFMFSIQELNFLQDHYALLTITKPTTLIGIPFFSLKKSGLNFQDWKFQNIGLYVLSIDKLFSKLKRQTLIKFSKELEFLKFSHEKWIDEILYSYDAKDGQMLDKNQVFQNKRKFFVSDSQSDLVILLKGKLNFEKILRKNRKKKNGKKKKELEESAITHYGVETSKFEILNRDEFIKNGKISKYSMKIKGKIKVSEGPTVLALVNFYKTAQLLNDEFNDIKESEKNEEAENSVFEEDVPEISEMNHLLDLGQDYNGSESVMAKKDSDILYFVRRMRKEVIKQFNFQNQLLVINLNNFDRTKSKFGST